MIESSGTKAEAFLGYRIGKNIGSFKFQQHTREHYEFLKDLLLPEGNFNERNSVKNFKELIEFLKRKVHSDFDHYIEAKYKRLSTFEGTFSLGSQEDEEDTKLKYFQNDLRFLENDENIHSDNFDLFSIQNQGLPSQTDVCFQDFSIDFHHVGNGTNSSPNQNEVSFAKFKVEESIEDLKLSLQNDKASN